MNINPFGSSPLNPDSDKDVPAHSEERSLKHSDIDKIKTAVHSIEKKVLDSQLSTQKLSYLTCSLINFLARILPSSFIQSLLHFFLSSSDQASIKENQEKIHETIHSLKEIYPHLNELDELEAKVNENSSLDKLYDFEALPLEKVEAAARKKEAGQAKREFKSLKSNNKHKLSEAIERGFEYATIKILDMNKKSLDDYGREVPKNLATAIKKVAQEGNYELFKLITDRYLGKNNHSSRFDRIQNRLSLDISSILIKYNQGDMLMKVLSEGEPSKDYLAREPLYTAVEHGKLDIAEKLIKTYGLSQDLLAKISMQPDRKEASTLKEQLDDLRKGLDYADRPQFTVKKERGSFGDIYEQTPKKGILKKEGKRRGKEAKQTAFSFSEDREKEGERKA